MNELEKLHVMLCNSIYFEYTFLSRFCDVKILSHCYQVESRIMYSSMSWFINEAQALELGWLGTAELCQYVLLRTLPSIKEWTFQRGFKYKLFYWEPKQRLFCRHQRRGANL